jgi:hypothetical protein
MVVGAVRRFLLWALEFWTGDQYARVSLLHEWVPEGSLLPAAVYAAVKYARAHERDR